MYPTIHIFSSTAVQFYMTEPDEIEGVHLVSSLYLTADDVQPLLMMGKSQL